MAASRCSGRACTVAADTVAPERDQILGIVLQPLDLDVRGLVDRRLQEGAGVEPHQAAIAALACRELHDPRRIRSLRIPRIGVQVAEIDRELAAGDRLDAVTGHLVGELQRPLQLAAEASGVIAFALRRSGSTSDEANACFSRWRVSPSPSGPMVDFDIGRARWRLDLLRCRGAQANSFTVEACDATGRLAVPADLGDRSPAAQEWRLATA